MVSGPAIATLAVFILSIVCVIFPFSIPIPLPYLGRKRIPVNLTTAPIIAIIVLWPAQCLTTKNVRDGIVGTDGVQPYNILILFFSLAYMAITLDITGILQAAAFWVSNRGGSNGWKLFTYFYIMLTVLSIVLGNDPVILSGTAFLVYYTRVNELNPIAWLMSEFAAANTASMVLFVGNPTNVVICEGFSINNAAFTAYTILPFLACSIACFFALASQFHHSKYLPRQLNVAGDLDVRSVLLDPKGAWVGSFLLGSCLAILILISFLHVDVWKITLPFASAKFIFDILWDFYHFVNKIPHPQAEGILLRQLEGHRRPAAPQNDCLEQVHTDGVDIRGETPEVCATSSSTLQPKLNSRSKHQDKEVQEREEGELTSHKSSQQPRDKTLMSLFPRLKKKLRAIKQMFATRFPTLYTAFPRLPFALVPFAFSQFILIEALAYQGWIEIFAHWLVAATGRRIHPTVWLVGVLGVILCNCSGTNIGATILLTKVVRHATLSAPAGTNVNLDAFNRSAAIALAVSSNIGAVSFTFSASLAGLLWKQILNQKGIYVKQRTFARWNILPLVVMTGVGLGIVSAEMAVLF